MHRIVVLDTPGCDLRDLAETFGRAGDLKCDVATVGSLDALLADIAGPKPTDLIVLDYQLGDGVHGGKEILAAIRSADEQVPVIVVAQQGDVALAAEAVGAGATDLLIRGDHLRQRVSTVLGKARNLLELIDHNRALREQNVLLQQAQQERYHIVGESPQVLEMLRQIKRVAKIPRPVLIVGERGTGKELVARAIHQASGRSGRPFVVINCAAATETLLESELFGHERGAFTGANSISYGKFEQADGGTLFLDEIGNMSLPFQQKVLRVVEYGTFTRVGGSKEIRSTARVLAATNADLSDAIRQGRFLQDLYDRLSFEVLRVPPLRERQGDIEILARHFLAEFMREIPAMGGKHLGPEAIDVLRRYRFPGNVREMKNIIERAAYREIDSEIKPADIDMYDVAPPAPAPEVQGQAAGCRGLSSPDGCRGLPGLPGNHGDGSLVADGANAGCCGLPSPDGCRGLPPLGGNHAESESLDPPAAAAAADGAFESSVEDFKKRLIVDALSRSAGNQAQAARSLGLSYHQYRYFLRKYSGQ